MPTAVCCWRFLLGEGRARDVSTCLAFTFVTAFDGWRGWGAARPGTAGSREGQVGPTTHPHHASDGGREWSAPPDLSEEEAAGRAAPNSVVQGQGMADEVVEIIRGGAVVDRARAQEREAATDRAFLWWIGRFRFVTARELGVRFSVSEQRANARVRRLLKAGLLDEIRPHVSASRVVFLTGRGSRQLGLGERRPPRTDIQRRHELELAMLVARLEQQLPLGAQRLLTERECRRVERRSRGSDRYSVDVWDRNHVQKRWPDLVHVHPDGRKRAIEIELAVKHTRRLENILTGYRASGTFREVLWLVENPALLRRLERMISDRVGSGARVAMRTRSYPPTGGRGPA